ncbi:MAG: helix-turn-helix transcriptional regulator [Treponema sp.]|nr:helix-turn-helix transcriptional regulator [Treponema sp.]
MNESVRNRIEERLRARQMTQRDLAARLGVSEVTVSRWLSGERTPSIETMGKIANALGTTISYLLSENRGSVEQRPAEEWDDPSGLGKFLVGTALSATAVIGIVALAKFMGKLSDKDTEQIADILNRE